MALYHPPGESSEKSTGRSSSANTVASTAEGTTVPDFFASHLQGAAVRIYNLTETGYFQKVNIVRVSGGKYQPYVTLLAFSTGAGLCRQHSGWPSLGKQGALS